MLKRGGSSHNAFVVLDGRLEAHADGQAVGTLEPGDVFGETAFLLHQPRSRDVYAVEPATRILTLSERVLRTVINDEPATGAKLLTNISRMLCTRASRVREGAGS